MMRALRRDPFARTTLVRIDHRPIGAETCGWCGGRRRRPAFLYRYGTQPDALHTRVSWHAGAFCSLACHDTYHDIA